MSNRPSYEESVKEIESGFMVGSLDLEKRSPIKIVPPGILAGHCIRRSSVGLVKITIVDGSKNCSIDVRTSFERGSLQG